MAKSKEKIQARKLRKRGESIKGISKKLSVSRGTASLWCRDITLSQDQIQRLHMRQIRGGYAGRLKGARIQHERRIERIEKHRKAAKKILRNFSQREFLFAGAALYWGEGGKTDTRVRISNSDPKLISFMMKWFRDIMSITDDRFNFFVIINEIHKHRIWEIEQFWVGVVRCPSGQFWKPAFIRSKNKKIYQNSEKYFGTLHIEIRKSVEEKYRILGIIDAFSDYEE